MSLHSSTRFSPKIILNVPQDLLSLAMCSNILPVLQMFNVSQEQKQCELWCQIVLSLFFFFLSNLSMWQKGKTNVHLKIKSKMWVNNSDTWHTQLWLMVYVKPNRTGHDWSLDIAFGVHNIKKKNAHDNISSSCQISEKNKTQIWTSMWCLTKRKIASTERLGSNSP